MTRETLSIIQIVLGVILLALILMQTKGTGLGSTFGGEIGFYQTRRGVEKLLFYLTILVSIIFMVSSALGLLL